MNQLFKYLVVIGTLILIGCRKDVTMVQSNFVSFIPAPCGDSIFYQNEIEPQIINLSCNVAGCHSTIATAGGISYTNYSEVSANTHPMYMAMIQDSSTSDIHLLQTQIPDSLLQKFYCWIQQGRLNN